MTINDLGAAAAAIVEARAVGGHLDDLMAAMARCFRRWEPRAQAKKYVRALMSDLPRKNLGRQILADLHAEDRLPPWVTGDEVYGASPHLRTWLESPEVDTGYVLGIAKSTPIAFTTATTRRADSAWKMLTPSGWVIDSCRIGSKGERRYAWAWIGTADPGRHPLIRRSLTPNDKGIHELAFYLCFVPEGRPVTLRTLIMIAGRGWPIEEDFQTGKDAFGLDHSQVRTYPALLRHLVLTMAALAVCAVTAARSRTTTVSTAPPPTSPDAIPPVDPGLIPLTVPEVKRLVNLLTRTWHGLEHHLRWHIWRRRHQARARWFHQRTRLTRR